MPIALLSESTFNAIGSLLVLNDAVSVVKELIDNALDAHASAIAIEISANTLDAIQVKDNGIGIGLEDRQLVCKKGCTSKIRKLEDLEKLGGSSLGFRGEALFSVLTLSEKIVLTTRVDGEVVGSMLTYGRAGKMLSSSSASHPVGTTVRVHSFLQPIPVRVQAALKTTTKTLLRIKNLLYVYAFARPSTRFSLKVLKGKNDKANWMYAAKPGITLTQAVATILSSETASRCRNVSVSSGNSKDHKDADLHYTISGLLMSIEREFSNADNPGHFIAIDGRPVSSVRGPMHEIVKQYKSHFSNAYRARHGSPTSLNPFLCLHITCPPGSYDVNMEPAKDEVLFVDPTEMIALAKKLFVDTYGPVTKHDDDEAKSPSNKMNEAQGLASTFDLLLARKSGISCLPSELTQTQDPEHDTPERDLSLPANAGSANSSAGNMTVYQQSLEPLSEEYQALPENRSQPQKAKIFNNMYSIDDEDLWDRVVPSSEQDRHDSGVDDNECVARATNPWSIARLNAPVNNEQSLQATANSQNLTPEPAMPRPAISWSSPPTVDQAPHTHQTPLVGGPILLPTPKTSPQSFIAYQNPGPPIRRRPPRTTGIDDDVESDSELAQATKRAQRLVAQIKLASSSTELSSFPRGCEVVDRDGRVGNLPLGHLDENPGLALVTPFPQTAMLDRESASISPSSSVRKPFRWLFKNGQAQDRLEQRPLLLAGRPSTPLASPRLIDSQEDLELAEIMAFEHRKQAIAKQQRQSQSQVKIGNTLVDPAKLIGIQQASTRPDGRAERPPCEHPAPTFPDTIAAFQDRFTPGPSNVTTEMISLNSSRQSNPHQNRYLAATRSLGNFRPNVESRNMSEMEPDTPLVDKDPAMLSAATVSKMAADDPRAFLMRHRADTTGDGTPGIEKTGLKIRRTKSSRLPFETIPPNFEVHRLVTTVPHDVFDFEKAIPGLMKNDSYVNTGKNEWAHWSTFGKDATIWEESVKGLVKKLYRAKMGEGEMVIPEIEISVARAMKGYLENYGG